MYSIVEAVPAPDERLANHRVVQEWWHHVVVEAFEVANHHVL